MAVQRSAGNRATGKLAADRPGVPNGALQALDQATRAVDAMVTTTGYGGVLDRIGSAWCRKSEPADLSEADQQAATDQIYRRLGPDNVTLIRRFLWREDSVCSLPQALAWFQNEQCIHPANGQLDDITVQRLVSWIGTGGYREGWVSAWPEALGLLADYYQLPWNPARGRFSAPHDFRFGTGYDLDHRPVRTVCLADGRLVVLVSHTVLPIERQTEPAVHARLVRLLAEELDRAATCPEEHGYLADAEDGPATHFDRLAGAVLADDGLPASGPEALVDQGRQAVAAYDQLAAEDRTPQRYARYQRMLPVLFPELVRIATYAWRWKLDFWNADDRAWAIELAHRAFWDMSEDCRTSDIQLDYQHLVDPDRP